MEKGQSPINSARKTGQPHAKQTRPLSHHRQKLIHSGLKPLRPETIRVLKKKTQVACTVIWVSQYLFRYVFSVKENKNINKVDYIKLVSTEQRKPSIKWKDNLPNGKRYLQMIYQKRTHIYEFNDIFNNKKTIWLKNKQELNTYFSKEDI